MNIFDRLALNSLIKTILNFVLTIIKIFIPIKSDNHKPILRKRNRRNKTNE